MRSNEPLIKEIEGLNRRIDNQAHLLSQERDYSERLEKLVIRVHQNRALSQEQTKLLTDLRIKLEV